jgi:hypothetical protein
MAEIALLWQIDKAQTLRITLGRYENRCLVYRLSRGVYSLLEPTRLHPYELGVAVAGPLAYISGQTILDREGIINQPSRKIVMMGLKTKGFSLGGNDYLCWYLARRFLVNRTGIINQVGYDEATPLRAMADVQHRSPRLYFDSGDKIDPKELVKLKREVGYAFT